MKTYLLLALVATASLASGMAIAGVVGYGPLAYISYHIQGGSQSYSQPGVVVVPAYIDLGNLTVGQSGNVTVNASVTINSDGIYKIKLLHEEKLEKVFSKFEVKVTIGNNTVVLTPKKDSAYLNLTNGTYNANIQISYQVAKYVKGDVYVSKEPLLVLYPKGYDNHDQKYEQEDDYNS